MILLAALVASFPRVRADGESAVESVAFSRDGKNVAFTCEPDSDGYVVDTKRAYCRLLQENLGEIVTYAGSSTELVCTSSASGIRSYPSNVVLSPSSGNSQFSIAVAKNGLVAVGDDQNVVFFASRSSHLRALRTQGQGGVVSLSFLPDDSGLIAASSKSVQYFRCSLPGYAPDRAVASTQTESVVRSVTALSDRNAILATEKSIYVYDWFLKRRTRTLYAVPPHLRLMHACSCANAIGFDLADRSGRTVSIGVCPPRSGRVRREPFSKVVTTMAISRQGELALGSVGGRVYFCHP